MAELLALKKNTLSFSILRARILKEESISWNGSFDKNKSINFILHTIRLEKKCQIIEKSSPTLKEINFSQFGGGKDREVNNTRISCWWESLQRKLDKTGSLRAGRNMPHFSEPLQNAREPHRKVPISSIKPQLWTKMREGQEKGEGRLRELYSDGSQP